MDGSPPDTDRPASGPYVAWHSPDSKARLIHITAPDSFWPRGRSGTAAYCGMSAWPNRSGAKVIIALGADPPDGKSWCVQCVAMHAATVGDTVTSPPTTDHQGATMPDDPQDVPREAREDVADLRDESGALDPSALDLDPAAAKHPYGSLVEQVHRVMTTDQGVDAWVIAEAIVDVFTQREQRAVAAAGEHGRAGLTRLRDATAGAVLAEGGIDVDGAMLLSTTDAMVWAETFTRKFRRAMITDEPLDAGPGWVDTGGMLAWFANAIETGRSAGRGRLHSEAAVRDVLSSADCNCQPGDPTCADWRDLGHRWDNMADALWRAMTDGEYGTIPEPPTRRLVNLTPHDVVILQHDLDQGIDVEVERFSPSSAAPARLGTIDLGTRETIGNVWIEQVEFGHLNQLIPEVPGTYYIVSLPTALAVHRPDFVAPYDEVRDADGRIIGCRGLAMVMG